MPENYILLERIELNASASSVTFSNIPQTGYTDLVLKVSARSSYTGLVADDIAMTFNSVSSGYSDKVITGDGSSVYSFSNGSGTTKMYFGNIPGNATANTFSNTEVYIPNYTSSTSKSVSIDGSSENNATNAYLNLIAGLMSSTAAITSITLVSGRSANFVAGSTFSLYGIAALGTTPVIAPKAIGGNVIATDGTYWYHAFLSSGSFIPQTDLSCDVLVIAGGGGGGSYSAGGGAGAGGLLAHTSQSLTNGTQYFCTIGAGGAGSTVENIASTNGVNSQFAALTAATQKIVN